MELTQLEYFIETARREHISKTAEALNLTQPALSKSISRLEENLGVKLFERDGKSIRLNAYGKVALEYAQNILRNIDDLRGVLEQMQLGMAGSLRVGSSFPAQEPNWLLRAIRSFALRYPDVRFSLKEYSPEQLTAALNERQIDLAVASDPVRTSDCQWEELFTEPMGVILAQQHPLAQKQEISVSELLHERFYCNNANSDSLRLTRQFCAKAGFEPIVQFEGDYSSFIGEAVALGYGVSLISRRGYRRNLQKPQREEWEDSIVFRPLREKDCVRTCGIAYPPMRASSPVVQAFCDALRQQVQENVLEELEQT